MNINLHDYCEADGGRVFYCLGLVRIFESMPADKCLELIKTRLSKYDLELTDIIAFCTDGASLMKAVGKLANVQHQLCLSHGIHLSVSDAMYDRNLSSSVQVTDSDEGDSEEEEASDDIAPLSPSYKDCVEKVRRIVSLFRKSPVANDKLQVFVKESFGNELVLIRDIRIRWNSMYDMLERFLKLQTCVQQALLSLHKDHLFLRSEELGVIRDNPGIEMEAGL